MTDGAAARILRPDCRTLAIVAANDTYRTGTGLKPLQGAVRDAKSFVSWLQSNSGGNLPSDDIKVFVKKTGFTPPSRAHVTAFLAAIVRELRQLSDQTGEETPIERIYLYFVGHGEQASTSSGSAALDAAWLGQDFNKYDANDHLSGAALAEGLQKTGLFGEIIVVMDCCRTKMGVIRSIQPFELHFNNTPPNPPGYVVMFACEAEQPAYEQTAPGGSTKHGVFSLALHEGLKHKRVGGVLRVPELFDYLTLRMDFLRENRDGQVPDYKSEGRRGVQLVITNAAPGGPFPVTLDVKSTLTGESFEVISPSGQSLAAHPITRGCVSIDLDLGLYQATKVGGGKTIDFAVFPTMAPVEVDFA